MRADKLTTTFFVKTEDQELKDFLTSQNIDYSSRPSTNLIGVEAESEKQFLQWMEEYKNLKLTNTMEADNKLIAEFMGCENPQAWELIPSPYECDWNWLMDVVEKIEGLGNIVSTNFNSTDIKDLDTLKTIVYNRGSWKEFTPELTKQQSVYKACAEFIKWYNTQKN